MPFCRPNYLNASSKNICNNADISTDLISGEYEGGLKCWECSDDLQAYLADLEYSLEGRKVLEIGCGLGECGSVCVKKGSSVLFQDYNENVISELVGIHQSKLAVSDREKCRYFYGSWEDLHTQTADEEFDMIIGSEILYNEENYPVIISILKSRLTLGGIGVIATKNMYFGLSGSLYSFVAALKTISELKFEILNVHEHNIPRSLIIIKRT